MKKTIALLITLCCLSLNAQPYFMLSIPKSGTHLLTKTLTLLTDNNEPLCLAFDPFFKNQHYHFPPVINLAPETFMLHYPQYPGQCMYNHLNFSYLFHPFSQAHPDYAPIIMIRDLRDALVSMAYYRGFPDHIQTIEDKILFLINNIKDTSVWNIKSHAKQALIWMQDPNTTLIRFENLIGEQGGGSQELQTAEIQKLANALDIPLTDELLSHTQNNMWGDTWTFRKGQIGQWKTHFTPALKKAFKKSMGKQLIKLGYEQNNGW